MTPGPYHEGSAGDHAARAAGADAARRVVLTSVDAARVLALGLAGPRRPVDELIERLRERDGAAWLQQALATEPKLAALAAVGVCGAAEEADSPSRQLSSATARTDPDTTREADGPSGHAPVREAGREQAACPPLRDLMDMKERAKERIAGAATVDAANQALAVYCLCIGAALARHGELISSQPREQWDALLLDLAEVLPPPWPNLLQAAAQRD